MRIRCMDRTAMPKKPSGRRRPMILCWRGHTCLNMRPLAGRAVDRQRTAKARCALAHRAQPQMAGKRSRGIEANPVVANVEHDLRRLRGWAAQPQCDGAGAGVLDDVMQRLLSDSVERLFCVQRQLRLLTQL